MATYEQSEPKGNPKHQNLTNPCNATNRSGERCKLPAMKGGKVCRSHGGAAPQVKAAAKRRLEEAADRMAKSLLGIATSAESESVRLAAIRDALDRAGLAAPKQTDVTVEVKPFDQLYDDVMTSGTRADYRRSIGHPDPEPEPLAIEPPTRPGGPRVLASHPDGQPFIIDAEPEDFGGDSESAAECDDDDEGDERGRQTLANSSLTFPATQPGYMDTETAMEAAADANRAHRHRMTRR